jgi:hypothetical protein
MRRTPWPLAALAVVALIGAGCSDASSENADTGAGASSGANTKTSDRDKAVRFAECMRDNGVRGFPDPDASGELTIDGIVNGSSLDPSSPAWTKAIAACKDLQPSGFTGHKATPKEQTVRLRFARCMRDNGVEDFPDPAPDAPLIDTNRIPSAAGRGARSIPGFDAAAQKCRTAFSDGLGLGDQ